jgi:hypothetical protein
MTTPEPVLMPRSSECGGSPDAPNLLALLRAARSVRPADRIGVHTTLPILGYASGSTRLMARYV